VCARAEQAGATARVQPQLENAELVALHMELFVFGKISRFQVSLLHDARCGYRKGGAFSNPVRVSIHNADTKE
jgi:hypothetical protein